MVAAVWIWPVVRSPRLWFGLSVLAIAGAAIWMATDLFPFIESRGWSSAVGLRALFLFISEVDKPVLQLICGLLLAAFFARRYSNADARKTTAAPSPAIDEKPALAD